ncbi:cytochrome c oxidase subunit [Ophiostoma piceae UAMH 11346]|uniref:Cytochrome c oxidase subunit n=1 Tax=Ophiostoma piceae (strain UAMH 11346) TaxID=1262450 RepID=S3BTG1_OPHP1|nr:cytochrome c oxidase subunit [Ophiostoma piceae UAMH 11346]
MFRAAFARRSAQAARRFYSASAGPAGETEYVRNRRLVQEHAASTTSLWRNLSIYATIPVVIAALANAYYRYQEHVEHESHLPPLEERTEYPYQNIRTKNFPWGDGDKTIFWNPKVNYHNKDKVV